MPIIALVLSTLAFWIFYWFVRMGGVDHIRASSEKRKEEARRVAARERERTACLRAVDDPREAATILMLLMARVESDLTKEHITAIERLIHVTFGFRTGAGGTHDRGAFHRKSRGRL
jgi:1,6-anhydro-N-acetylmuramate kinase